MTKRLTLWATLILCLLGCLAAGILTVRVHAQDGDDNDSASDVIWQGLWNGSHFNATPIDTPAPDTEDTETKVHKHTPSTHQVQRQKVYATPETPLYAALGDSVAAGLGLSSNQTRCGRSDAAYPIQVATANGISLIHAACSGATAGDLFTKQRRGGPNLQPQLDSAFAYGTPKLITITAGANDAHWVQFARKCYRSTCGTERDNRVADGLLAALRVKLDYAFSDIARRSGDHPPKVIITGYYNPLSDECSAIELRLTPTEITWLGNRIALLNQTIKDVSDEYSFVTYAPVSFAGHDICANNPWVQGLQEPAPFHPNAQGQIVIARAILAVQN